MSAELFEKEESLSPRLAWLKQHGLTLRKTDGGKWECVLDEENFGTAATADEACIDFCLKTGLPHWRTPWT